MRPETDPHRRGQAATNRGSRPAHNRPFSLTRESVSISPTASNAFQPYAEVQGGKGGVRAMELAWQPVLAARGASSSGRSPAQPGGSVPLAAPRGFTEHN